MANSEKPQSDLGLSVLTVRVITVASDRFVVFFLFINESLFFFLFSLSEHRVLIRAGQDRTDRQTGR